MTTLQSAPSAGLEQRLQTDQRCPVRPVETMPLLRLTARVEHASLARQNLCLDNIDLAATLLAPQPRASAAPDGQNLVGLDGDFYPFMYRDGLL